MRLPTHRSLAIALAAAFAAATVACQSAQKQTFIPPPPQAQAPAITTVSKPPAPAQAKVEAVAAPEPQVKPPAPPVPKSDPVADLIARVEKEYQAGLDSYHAGNMDAAKKSFDTAINLLLNADAGLRSDDRLDNELDHIMEGVNGLDLLNSQEADSSAPQQKSEPAPIDEVNEVTPSVDANVKAKAEDEIKSTHSDLPLMMTDQVAGYINFFSNRGRGTLERALARSGRYEDMIRQILKEEGVPQDLIYLAQAESGFHPLAVSRAGARGMWQFMGSRARGYGLHRDFWVDERQDPEKATHAAARHLKDLYNQFGDWYLAMAAYNSGPGTVQSAVKRTGYADFWELYRRNVLPRETRNYVPIIVAVTIMAKNPEQYGLDDVNRDQPIPYDTVHIDYQIDLRLVAQCIDATVADIQDLNPSLLRLTTPKGHPFDLRLPQGTKEKYLAAIETIPADKRLWWRFHTVESGETLASLSRAYRIPIKSITAANNLEADSPEAGTRLVIPIPPGKYTDTAAYARRITRYRIRKGDTAQSVAENFAVPLRMLRGWNHLRGNSLAGRRYLYLHLPLTPGAPGAKIAAVKTTSKASTHVVKTASTSPNGVVHHKVKPGDTLYSIANAYNTTVSALRRDNRNTSILKPGMILIIRGAR
jgi:membrane-bound lytic murein transglycosylase D